MVERHEVAVLRLDIAEYYAIASNHDDAAANNRFARVLCLPDALTTDRFDLVHQLASPFLSDDRAAQKIVVHVALVTLPGRVAQQLGKVSAASLQQLGDDRIAIRLRPKR